MDADGGIVIYIATEKPDIGPDWQFRLRVQVLLPASIIMGG